MADLQSRRPPRGTVVSRGDRDRAGRRRSGLVISAFLFLTVAATVYLVAWSPAPADPPATAMTPPPSSPSGLPTPDPSPSEPPPVLSLPGEFPQEGPGTFQFADTEGAALGHSGTLRRFRLAAEDNIDADLAELIQFVDDTLSDPEGWTAGGQWQLQRVPEGAPYDFTIYLATGATAAQMCSWGGLNIMGEGLPEGGVSCHYSGNVVLNLHRWRLSVPHYVEQEVPLEVYRQMVLNHEVGHALGLGHEACPEPGAPAPVMQQQTISLGECEAYPWPYRNGERYTGPSVP